MGYCELHQIAAEKELTEKTSVINFNSKLRKWKVEKWEYNENSAFDKRITLQVDSMKIDEIESYGTY